MMAWTWCDGKGMEKSNPSGMSSRYGGIRLAQPVNTDIYRELLRQYVAPWVQRTCPGEKSLSADLALVYTTRTTRQLLAEFPTLADWLLYSPDLNLLASLSRAFFRHKSRLFLTLIWTPYVCPLLRNGTSKQGNTSVRPYDHSATTVKLSLRKMKFKLNRWAATSPTHQPVVFRATISFNKTWRPIHGKKHFIPRLTTSNITLCIVLQYLIS